ncbi:FAD-dependent oxidoreductase [Eleftheria terrae]|uniref:FAD-dependent oxidoreductase n=1 Tax=Eleftheria terrae TaxID=1597781 RepID=UPI00263AADD0|nr:FAD-dependent oxidoreductase [Eleftheria terrae]WKB51672.1 FAD-dependent oxidoreductase [Eleftheria terrae]
MPRLSRRACLALGGAALAAGPLGCAPSKDAPGYPATWVGASAERGHRLRSPGPAGGWPAAAVQRRASVLVVGGGVAGLAAARTLVQAGIDDVHLLELEDHAGGNSRAHRMSGMACPLGAHYLPLPGPDAREVAELLEALGLSRQQAGRTVYDERHLCHSPQERLFIDGAWVDGLLPPAPAGSPTLAQYRRFAQRLRELGAELRFAMPTLGSGWQAGHDALDRQTFEQWLQAEGLDDARLRWYLDYCCRDDYGGGLAVVSAWAGLHYFASRHGFHVPGDGEVEREPVLTWPQGNAWLTERLAQALPDRLQAGRTVLRVSESRHEVRVLAWDEARQQAEDWTAGHVVMATPLFIAARLLAQAPSGLVEAVRQQRHAPWLVSNLQLDEPLQGRRRDAPPSWDNVRHGGDPRALGYVDAMHQSLRPHAGPTVLTVYWALPIAQRSALLQDSAAAWAARVVADLAVVHPDLPTKLRRADLMRWGHAMSVPVPGLRGSAALQALGRAAGRVRFAHADLSAYSVFEEAYTWGVRVAGRLAGELRSRRVS